MKNITLFLTCFLILALPNIYAFDHQVFGTETWYPSTVPNLNNKDLIIEKGATLIITSGCYLYLSPEKQIKLKANSKIIIEDSEITGNWWKGFVFDNSSFQGNDIPGVVIIKDNSIVSRAKVVFQVSGSKFGGGILASNSQFENNRKIMIMGPHTYTGGMANSCSFDNCDFYTTQCCFTENDIWFNLSGVKNIRFTGCRFMNHLLNVAAVTAIRASNTRITIEQSTYMNGNPNRRSVFSGFPANVLNSNYAIEITNNISDQTSKVRISNCDFTAISAYGYNYPVNQKAIFLKGCSNSEIYSNNFDLISDGTNEKHGIFLDDCTGFIVEDNEISATAPSGSPLLTFGIIIKNSNDQTNEVYRNRLYNTHYGIQAREKNRGADDLHMPVQGLKFLCNEFNSFNTAYYMSAVDCNNSNPLFGVSQWQQGAILGAHGSPCFNLLAPRQLAIGSTYDFHNDHYTLGPWDIQYMLPSGSPGNYSISRFSNTIYPNPDPTTTTQDPHCESRLPCIGPLCPVLVGPMTKNSYNPNMSTMKTQLLGLVNSGDHSYLLSLVESVDARSLSTVYDTLMTSTPSHDILTIAVENELFSASMIRDILVQNSYGIKSWSVREALAFRDDALTADMMNDINDAASELSEYEELMYKIDYMNQEHLFVMNRSLDVIISRDSIPMDSVKMYLDSIGDMISLIRLIHIAFEEGNISSAGRHYEAFEIIANDMAELEYYGLLYEYVLLDIYTNHSGDFSQMDETQIDLLYNLIETNTYAAAIGKYLLSAYGDYLWTAQYCEMEQNSQRKGQVKDAKTTDQPVLLLYPNPATNQVNVVISGMDATIADVEIRDISGKMMAKEQIHAETGRIDVSLLKPGLYILRVNANDIVLSKPLIITK